MATIKSIIERIILEVNSKNNSICPNCKKTSLLLDEEVLVPFKVSLLFFKVTINLNVKIKYCSSCGYLKIEVLT